MSVNVASHYLYHDLRFFYKLVQTFCIFVFFLRKNHCPATPALHPAHIQNMMVHRAYHKKGYTVTWMWYASSFMWYMNSICIIYIVLKEGRGIHQYLYWPHDHILYAGKYLYLQVNWGHNGRGQKKTPVFILARGNIGFPCILLSNKDPV